MECNAIRIPHRLISVTEERENAIGSSAERAAIKRKTQSAILEGQSQRESLINNPSYWLNSSCAATRHLLCA